MQAYNSKYQSQQRTPPCNIKETLARLRPLCCKSKTAAVSDMTKENEQRRQIQIKSSMGVRMCEMTALHCRHSGNELSGITLLSECRETSSVPPPSTLEQYQHEPSNISTSLFIRATTLQIAQCGSPLPHLCKS